jgi:hypothetical protein
MTDGDKKPIRATIALPDAHHAWDGASPRTVCWVKVGLNRQ